LTGKGVEFNEIDVTFDQERRGEMTERAGGRSTVPEIFIDGVLVGGSEELNALEASGGLDKLLGRAA
jgi:glutaredoxin 3